MRKLSLLTLATSSLFLFGCLGCCSGMTEGFEKGFNESFAPSFRDSFVKSCTPGLTNVAPAEADRICGCMADHMLANHSPGELTTLSLQTDSPEFQKMASDAATACVGQ